MKYTISLLFLFQIILATYGQIEFESGYYVDNDGNRIDCLIKNREWTINPEIFDYKIGENEVSTASIDDAKEFGVGNKKYIRAIVDIDMPAKASSMSYERDFTFVRDTIFVRSLVEGKASLFSYTTSQSKIFLLKTAEKEITQLAYKQYLLPDERIVENNRYKTQVQGHLQHPEIPISEIEKLTYKENALTKYFMKYNSLFGESIALNKNEKNKGDWHYAIKLGAFQSTVSNDNSHFLTELDGEYSLEITPRIGIEIEYNLPVKGNKWSLIQEITYTSQQSDGTVKGRLAITYGNSEFTVFPINNASSYVFKYVQVSLPGAVRYYSFLSDKSKIMITGGAYLDIPFGSRVTWDNENLAELNLAELKITPVLLYKFGIGYVYNNKLGIEFSNEFGRKKINVKPDYNPYDIQHWNFNINGMALMLTYRIK